MKDAKFNFYSFWELQEDSGKTKLECLSFTDDFMGQYAVEEDTEIGHKYQILLVRDHEEDEDKYTDLDVFEAILSHPITYINQLIPSGWYGFVIRKSDKSREYIQSAVAELTKLL